MLTMDLEYEKLRYVKEPSPSTFDSISLSDLLSDSLSCMFKYGEPLTATTTECQPWGTTQKPEYDHVMHETLKIIREVIYTVHGNISFNEIKLYILEDPQQVKLACRFVQNNIDKWGTLYRSYA